MSAAQATNEPTLPRRSGPSRSSRLLAVIRKLIAFGQALAQVLSQSPADSVDARTAHEFGTSSLNLILQRIRLGLLRAAALEARVEKQAATLDKTPFQLPRLPSDAPRAPPSGEPRPDAPPAAPADALLAQMPSVEEIAQEIRRRSIGAVLADICRDLGIGLGHPLWTEVNCIMLDNGASASLRLTREAVERKLAWDDLQALRAQPAAMSAPVVPEPECAATGPP